MEVFHFCRKEQKNGNEQTEWHLDKNRKEVQEQEYKRAKEQEPDQERKIKRINQFSLQKLKCWS